jgi:hypothetical protein
MNLELEKNSLEELKLRYYMRKIGTDKAIDGVNKKLARLHLEPKEYKQNKTEITQAMFEYKLHKKLGEFHNEMVELIAGRIHDIDLEILEQERSKTLC